ncbi:MAG: antitoxin [Sporichthyaceae bacterium]
MSKRLQVVVGDEELDRFAAIAEQQGMTLSEWVRQILRAAERSRSTGDVERKLAAIDRAASLNLGPPEVDIEQMLEEIDAGRRAGWLPDLP